MTQFKNAAVKSMVVMRKAFRTIDAKVSESFREFGLTPTQFGVLDVLFAKGGAMKIGELIDSMLATSGKPLRYELRYIRYSAYVILGIGFYSGRCAKGFYGDENLQTD